MEWVFLEGMKQGSWLSILMLSVPKTASYTTERRRAAAFLACGMLLEDNRVERKRVSYSNKWLLLQ